MFWQRAMKYPVLIIGIVFFGLYITNPKTKEFWENHFGKMKPSTCRVTVERFKKNSQKDWSFHCPSTQSLSIEIKSELADKYSRALLYKELANSLSYLGHKTNPETLGYLKKVSVKLIHPKLTIDAITDGPAINQMAQTKDRETLFDILKLSVRTKEI